MDINKINHYYWNLEKDEHIKKIISEAINIERWAPKTNNTYPFIEDDERKEMVDNILKYLKEKEYKIIKIK